VTPVSSLFFMGIETLVLLSAIAARPQLAAAPAASPPPPPTPHGLSSQLLPSYDLRFVVAPAPWFGIGELATPGRTRHIASSWQ